MLLPALPLREGESSEGTPYAQAERKAADCMRVVREYISQLDALAPSDDPTPRNDLLLSIRTMDNTLRRVMMDARRCAAQEQRERDLKELQRHCEATQALVRARYNAKPTSAAVGISLDGDEKLEGSEEVERYDLHQDEEFALFFNKTKERDEEIEVVLDRIHECVLRTNENAHGIKEEMRVQNKLMKNTDKKVDNTQTDVVSMNRKMQRAIKKLGKSRLITYCVMCVILVVLIIVIGFLAKSL